MPGTGSRSVGSSPSPEVSSAGCMASASTLRSWRTTARAQLPRRRLGQPEDLLEVLDLPVVVEREPVGDPERPGAARPAAIEGRARPVDRGVVEAVGRQHQDLLALELAGDELVEALLDEVLVDLLGDVDLVLEHGVLLFQGVVLLLDVGEVLLEGVDGGAVDERGAEGEPDAERQEDRGDGDDVVAEVDHAQVKRYQIERKRRRTGSLTMAKMPSVRQALPTRAARWMGRTEVW